MCRYAFKTYKSTFVCFKCQTGFKRRNISDIDANTTESKDAKCPTCGAEAFNVGRDIRLPKKENSVQWQCIKYLVDHKYNIYSCGCSGIGFVPHKMADAIALVKDAANKAIAYSYAQAKMEKKEALEEKRRSKG
jgi:hypothetical protein